MYELLIGWRYLYRGANSPRAAIGFFAGLAVTAIGAILFFVTGGSSGIAVFALAGGMFATVLFGLLYFLSVFTTVSVLGVVLGVAALTVVLAVTSGFQKQFRDKVLGVNAHVIIMKDTNDFENYREVEKLAREIDPGVIAVQPFIFVEMLVTRGAGELSGVAIKGVDPERVTSVLDLQKNMVRGTVDTLAAAGKEGEPAPIILGEELAKKLNADIGDTLTVVAPLSNIDMETLTATGEAPKQREFRISGIFYSGFDEYDRRLMYVHLKEAQALLGQGDKVMGVELKVKDVARADSIARKIEKKLAKEDPYAGQAFRVQDWHELNHNLFTALFLQKLVLLIILTLIVGVAAFNMVSALTMMVIDKTREIAILKSMGTPSRGVARIFVVVGAAIGGVGTVFGLIIGLILCQVVNTYDYRLDPKVYLIDRLPISVSITEVLMIGGITLVIGTLATLLPSFRASGLNPVEGLRHD